MIVKKLLERCYMLLPLINLQDSLCLKNFLNIFQERNNDTSVLFMQNYVWMIYFPNSSVIARILHVHKRPPLYLCFSVSFPILIVTYDAVFSLRFVNVLAKSKLHILLILFIALLRFRLLAFSAFVAKFILVSAKEQN